ncbi:hypothetical protein LIER_19629 [Lithospermum erythrorhizon]|uniref:Uncharacterized protein n=1 Tax=Lithospermum erythrorhizon TaxID=34254 RepID=A0AAV3QL38_LITER
MTIKQRETELIASFQERFQTEFNLIHGVNKKIVVIAFVEGLRLKKFKELLLKRNPQDLEEVNERAYKYIQIEEAEKQAQKGRRKRPVDNNRRRSPEPKRRSTLDRIWAPDGAYSRTDLPRGSAFTRLQGDLRKRNDLKKGKIEYLAPLNTSTGNVNLEIEDRRLLPRPPRQKTPQNKRDMSKFCQYHEDHGHDIDCH